MQFSSYIQNGKCKPQHRPDTSKWISFIVNLAKWTGTYSRENWRFNSDLCPIWASCASSSPWPLIEESILDDHRGLSKVHLGEGGGNSSRQRENGHLKKTMAGYDDSSKMTFRPNARDRMSSPCPFQCGEAVKSDPLGNEFGVSLPMEAITFRLSDWFGAPKSAY